MLERDIEKKLKAEIEAMGGRCWKLVCPGYTGVPDRLVLMPGGLIAFVELKAPRKRERPRQLYVQDQIRKLGFKVFSSVDSESRIEDVVRWCRRSSRFREISEIKTADDEGVHWEEIGGNGV